MKKGISLRVLVIVATLSIAAFGFQSLIGDAHAASGNRKCARGVQSCSASQVGQPCNPNNLNVLCSAQANGSYCCLAYAP